jgi:hypothetical protein
MNLVSRVSNGLAVNRIACPGGPKAKNVLSELP